MRSHFIKVVSRLLFPCVALAASAARAAPLTAGNIIVSNSPFGAQDLFEYTPAGVRVQQIPVSPAGEGRDVVIDRDGRVQLYNGTFGPTLTTYDAKTNTFSSQSFAGWSTANNLTYGGIAAFGRYVFASDMATANAGAPQGVVRFDFDGGPTVRFATGIEPIDLNVGIDGRLYALSRNEGDGGGGRRVDVYDPATMAFVRTLILPDEHRGIAVDANGDIYGAERDDVSRVNHYSPAGVLLKSLNDPGIGGFADIDLDRSGRILVASHGGTLLLTTTALDSLTSFQTRSSNGYNFAAWIQTPVPEPATAGLLAPALAAALLARRRRHGPPAAG